MTQYIRQTQQLVLQDEATSNVDVDTDAKLQKTIRSEFASSTVITIAHRLHTIGTPLVIETLHVLTCFAAYCDRILVMDAGKVVEFDAPLALYDNPKSIFRSLCEEGSLSRNDIVRTQSVTLC